MEYSQIEVLEYKRPGYALKESVRFPENTAENRRYRYDETNGIWRSAAADKKKATLIFGGDLLCGERIIEGMRTKDGDFDFSLCFRYLKPLLHGADFAAANLETVVSHTAPLSGEILTHEGPRFVNSPVEYLRDLADAGFDMLTTENNHKLDAGARGVLETKENLERYGFISSGCGGEIENRFTVVNICGFKVGFTAFGTTYNRMRQNLTTEGCNQLLNKYSYERAEEILRAMYEKGAEYTVCFPHWGREYHEDLTDRQLEIVKDLATLGYDLVIGSHPRLLQKFKLVEGKAVAFSLGNLLSPLNSKLKKGVDYTALCTLELSRKDGKVEGDVKFIPCRVVKNYRGIPFAVLPVLSELNLLESQEYVLKRTARQVTERLECSAARIRTDFRVDEKIAETVKREHESIDSQPDHLLRVEKKVLEAASITVPTRHFWESCIGYHEEKHCLYKIYKEYAQLIRFAHKAEIVLLPNKVKKQKVESVSGDGKGNDSTRLINLGKYVKTIEAEAFCDYTALESVRLHSRVEAIGDRAFARCSGMIGIVIPHSVREIGKEAFADCTGLMSIKLPSGVEKIGKGAFKGCDKLTIYCEEDSFADHYAKENGISVKYMPLGGAHAEDDTDETSDEVEIDSKN